MDDRGLAARFSALARRSGAHWLFGSLAIVLLCTLAVSPAAAQTGDTDGAETLGWWAARGLLADARLALEQDDSARAVEIFRRVAEGRPARSDHRTRGLYGAATAELQRPEPDFDAARGWLSTLLTEMGTARDVRATAARALHAALARPPADERVVTIVRSDPAPRDPDADVTPPPEAEPEEVEALRRQLKALSAELAAARAEIVAKDEALEKLKQALVEGG
ncbi:MAG: hypothetical protein AAGN46_00475 [Acidobacteriota bacterium]